MPDHLDQVNAHVRRVRAWAADAKAKSQTDPWSPVADALQALVDENKNLRAWSKPVPSTYGDLSDLPPELLSQLSGSKTDPLEDQIYAIVKAAGDEIELDMLLIELFRRHGLVFQRRFITNKCYRMAQKSLIHIVPGRKGVYSIHVQEAAPQEHEAHDMEEEFGGYSSKPRARETFSADLDDEIPF